MKKLLLSLLSLLSLVYPQFLYGQGGRTELWKIFCAHRLLAQPLVATSETTNLVVFEDPQWLALVSDLDRRTMPIGFQQNDANLDAWLKCENEFEERFETAEFLHRGREHFSIASVTGAEGRSTVQVSNATDIYTERWEEFLKSLQKAVTLPKPRNTISMRSH